MTTGTIQERRRTIGNTLRNMLYKTSPLTAHEREQINGLNEELNLIEGDFQAERDQLRAKAFSNWLRRGGAPSSQQKGITPEERSLIAEIRDMGTGGAGAYPGITVFAPVSFMDMVTSATKYVGPMLDPEVATAHDTATGAPFAFPADNDTATTGEMVAENQQVTSSDVATISAAYLGSFKFSSKIIKVSMELAEDAGFDFAAYLARVFGVRLGRIINTKFTTGVGTTEPTGIVTAATQGAVAVGATGNDGSSGLNTIGSDDLANLEQSVDPTYRVGARWMVHPNTLGALRRQKDKEGRLLFPSLAEGTGNTLYGYPISLNPNMDQLQANTSSPPVARKTVLFGDFKRYTIRRAPLHIVRLDERFADFGEIGFIATWRMDGNLVDGGGGAVKYLVNNY